MSDNMYILRGITGCEELWRQRMLIEVEERKVGVNRTLGAVKLDVPRYRSAHLFRSPDLAYGALFPTHTPPLPWKASVRVLGSVRHLSPRECSSAARGSPPPAIRRDFGVVGG